MLKFLLEKEFKLIFRNPFLPRMIIMFPLMVLLVFPWAANFEIKNINLCVVDNDRSTCSTQLIYKISSSGYFRHVNSTASYKEALSDIEKDKANIILEIPAYFERELIRQNTVKVLISANTVNGTKGGLGSAYLSGIVNSFASEKREKWITISSLNAAPTIEVVLNNRFNIHLDYKVFMVPALMVMLLTMICGFLPALNIVSEKEAGTMEQVNVSPITRFNFIFSKLLPYWIIGFIVITISFGIATLFYKLIPAGSILTIYLFAAIYILTISGLGLVISNYSNTMQQAMFVIYFFMLLMIIMSGLFTPINSMPKWAQYITDINPLKYFMEVMRMVYLKGSRFVDLGLQFFVLSIFAIIFNLWAIASYKKNN